MNAACETAAEKEPWPSLYLFGACGYTLALLAILPVVTIAQLPGGKTAESHPTAWIWCLVALLAATILALWCFEVRRIASWPVWKQRLAAVTGWAAIYIYGALGSLIEWIF